MRKLLVVALLFTRIMSWIPKLFAQLPNITLYSVSNGLVSNQVRRLYQDKEGFLWIATLDGISRFDGYRFLNFTMEDGLPWNLANDFFEDEDNRLHIAFNNGTVAVIDQGQISAVYRHGITINQFCRMPDGRIIGTTDFNGLVVYKGSKLEKPQQPFPLYNFYGITLFEDSLLAVGNDSSLLLLSHDFRLKAMIGYQQKHLGENRIALEGGGRLWASHLPGLARIASTQIPGVFKQEQVPMSQPINVLHITQDEGGLMWTCGSGGVRVYYQGKEVGKLGRSDGLPSDEVNYLLEDREGNIWIGTSFGLCKTVRRLGLPFAQYKAKANLPADVYQSFYGLQQKPIYFDHGNYWQIESVSATDLQISKQPAANYSPIFVNGNPLTFNDQRLIDGGDNRWTGLQIQINSLGLHDLWNSDAGTNGAIAIITGKGKYLLPDREQKIELEKATTAALFDGQNNVWTGTWDKGVRLYYCRKGNSYSLQPDKRILDSIGVRSLFKDKQDRIWVGSRYHGIYMYSQDSTGYQVRFHLHSGNGLSSNWISLITQDAQGNIWLGYAGGLDKLIPAGTDSFRVFNFSRHTGLYFKANHFIQAAPHTYLANTAQGIIRIDDGLLENTSAPTVTITGIWAADSMRYAGFNALSLHHRQNSLRIDFAPLSFLNEKEMSFSYRLLGSSNNQWSSTSTSTSVSLANLQPGSYRFEVRCLGWNETWGSITGFDFNIQSPYWQTWWFLLSIALALGLLTYRIIKRRVQLIKAEAQVRQQITETEMKALRAQMNPHFLFNSINAIDSLIQTSQTDKATTYLARFARLLRRVLESSKMNLATFDKDFETLRLYLEMEKFRSADKFDYRMDAEAELLHGDIMVPPLLIQPFIENAIQHGLMNKLGNDRKISITARIEQDYLIYTIEDNGVGRARANELKTLNKPAYESYGIQIAAERIRLHNRSPVTGALEIEDVLQEGKISGTIVCVRLKIHD